jgi:xanthine dehydrogenase iron-sulfur cluster and FAD-binding subunit A
MEIFMLHEYRNVNSIDEALEILSERGKRARIVAGATDLMLEIERGVRVGIDTLVDVTRIPGLDQISIDDDDVIHLGPLVTHNHCVASKLIRKHAFPLAQAAWEVGSPQIRNRGTIVGNLITASPANDTITPLMVLGAVVTIRSSSRARIVPLQRFYRGVRDTVMQPDEMLVDIAFPAMGNYQLGTFIKLALRQAQAISLVNVAVLITFNRTESASLGKRTIKNAAITLGAVAPTIIHAQEAERYLAGRTLDGETIEEAAKLAEEASRPIDDVRSSRDYRREMVRVCTLRALRDVANGKISKNLPDDPVLLWGEKTLNTSSLNSSSKHTADRQLIQTRINGQDFTFKNGFEKSLLRLLREEAGLTGTKEGCAEGECGACTVFLDGTAVMSCLVPAARAHQAEIVTIEGLAQNGELHPVQQAFIDEGAVQCGYCTPGFIMSAAKLLEERAHPTVEEIKHSITGNLCRCTGYYKIVSAIEKASLMEISDV